MQVERYVKQLLAGGKVDIGGRPIHLGADTVFYCFIVADNLASWMSGLLMAEDRRMAAGGSSSLSMGSKA